MIFKGSIGRKYAMALSALFLLIFLTQHFLINFLSVISPNTFNAVSHFMGHNPLIQFLMQPILLFGVALHFILGFVLEFQNWKARPIKYAKNAAGDNSTWMSRNMIWTGGFILLFLIFHMNDFWVHEMKVKYICADAEAIENSTRYYPELLEMFKNPWRVLVYVIAFVFLALHLLHGFQSAFQSIGANHRKYTPFIKKLGTWYSILIPAGFIFIALYHYFLN